MATLKFLWTCLLAALLAVVALISGCTSDSQPGISGSFELVLPGTHLKASGRVTPPKVQAPIEQPIAPVVIPATPAAPPEK